MYSSTVMQYRYLISGFVITRQPFAGIIIIIVNVWFNQVLSFVYSILEVRFHSEHVHVGSNHVDVCAVIKLVTTI
jgi:hypothetical protein